MYDTLTQMGRWFGFRPNYSDLVRLHITPTLLEWFTWLTGVERELRSDIERYGQTGLKPDSLAVRILKHRKMLPTSRSKMRSARAFQPSLGASSLGQRSSLSTTSVLFEKTSKQLAVFFPQSVMVKKMQQGCCGEMSIPIWS